MFFFIYPKSQIRIFPTCINERDRPDIFLPVEIFIYSSGGVVDDATMQLI